MSVLIVRSNVRRLSKSSKLRVKELFNPSISEYSMEPRDLVRLPLHVSTVLNMCLWMKLDWWRNRCRGGRKIVYTRAQMQGGEL